MKISHNNIPIVQSLLLFYLLLCNTNLQTSLLSKDMAELIHDNKIIQHVIGFVTLMTLIILFSHDTAINIVDIISYSLIAYLIFVLSTKANVYLNVAIVVTLFGAFVYETYLNNGEKIIQDDKVLTMDEKKLVVDKIYYKKMYVLIGIILLVISGIYMYSSKSNQIGGFDSFGISHTNYNTFDFLFA